MTVKYRILTYGLTTEQNEVVKLLRPSKNYEVLDTDAFTDILAIYASAVIVNTEKLACDEYNTLVEYLSDVGDCTDTTTIWLGKAKPPKSLKSVKYYENFDMASKNLKYILLQAHKKINDSADYSKRLAEALMVLSLIRKHPGISTRELSENTEINIRTVQRYIATLQATGEWIEYDYKVRGWRLTDGISILFGDI